MDIFGILDPDTDPHENLCGSETLVFSTNSPHYTCQVVHPIFSILQIPELTPDIFGHAIRPMRILQVVYTVHTVRYETMALKQLVEKIK